MLSITQVIQSEKMPPILKALENQWFAMKLEVRASNILKQISSYYASGIYACASEHGEVHVGTTTPNAAIANTLTQVFSCNQSDYENNT